MDTIESNTFKAIMEQIEQLIEDYQRRLKEVTKMIEAAMLRGENFVRLNTKASCYRTFITIIT